MIPIREVTAEEACDSRGRPTIAVSVHTDFGHGTSTVPSGASTGSSEAFELRDEDGHMSTAVERVRTVLHDALSGLDVASQAVLDKSLLSLDGTPNKAHLGGNVCIGVSIAAAKAAAQSKGIETYQHLRACADIAPSRSTPYLYANYINGGKHADSPLAFQEHMLVPQSDSIEEALEMLETTGSSLESLIQAHYGDDAAKSMGDEGGFVLPEAEPRAPFALLVEAIEKAGHTGRIKIATDIAAMSFYKDGVYSVGERSYSKEELTALFQSLVQDFPILSIEDPFEEEGFDDFAQLQKFIDARIVGDDLTVTNATRLQTAIEKKSIRAIIIKPNQIGTLTETFATMKLARANDIDCIVSHRSGETNDDFIADLAFAFGVFGFKAGALRKPERRLKYERLRTISSQ